MKALWPALALLLALPACRAEENGGQLADSAIAWNWRVAQGKLRPSRVDDRLNGGSVALAGDCFRIVLADGTILTSDDCQLLAAPRIEPLRPDPASPTLARQLPGKQLTAEFSAPAWNLSAEWRVILREGSSYVRPELTLRALGRNLPVREIVLLDECVPEAHEVGTVDGSPVLAGNFFFAYEHPMAENKVGPGSEVTCRFRRNAVLLKGESLTQSCVVGVVPSGQLRRGFLTYLERERAHPYRTFLHYNSWYDIAWHTRKFNEAECLDAIAQFGGELTLKRQVRLDSFMFDDGWDDNHTLWKFHSGFPNGYARLRVAAAKFEAGIGIWLSPFGGYDEAKVERLAYGTRLGFETNSSGFSLAGPRYYRYFHDACLEMIQKYGVNQFKFDGLAAAAKASDHGLVRDGDAMLRLIADLRSAEPEIYINQTTGTWPSPFWLLFVDSTWRGGQDHAFQGKGSNCQRWMTYRDMETYRNVVKQGPLYPLNSLMLHGLIYATYADGLKSMDDGDFRSQTRAFFGSGTQLQELYITGGLLSSRNWDDLAEAARWSRKNADVLVDSHWIGGDPGKDEVYGWASWSPRKSVIVLRNPDDRPAALTGDVGQLFQLPSGAKTDFRLQSPWREDSIPPVLEVRSGEPHTFILKPFEVLVLESQ